jgi:hypothetical protein
MTTATYIYAGVPVDDTRSVTFTVPMTDEAVERLVRFTVSAEREIRLTGSGVWPRGIHRGQRIALSINGERFEGRVKWRRLATLVMIAKPIDIGLRF